MTLIYGSVCSGIEAATMAWHSLGWKAAFFSEIEKFPSAVLAHHYGSNMPGEPLSKNGIPNYGDFTQIEANAGPIDLLVGGTPCQSFSVAGKRLGLDDPRGNLALEYLSLARRLRARWIVWENVPGVLSSVTDEEDGEGGVQPGLEGRQAGDEWTEESDFATFLSFVRECGYGFAYRVLDAQYVRVDGFGRAVPQRRRRVFLVGYLGDWRRAAAVLLEPQGMRGDSPPSRKAGQGSSADVAPSIVSSGRGVERAGDTRGQDPVVAVHVDPVASCVTRGFAQRIDAETENFVAHQNPIAFEANMSLQEPDDSGAHPTLTRRTHAAVCVSPSHPMTLAIRGRGGEPDIEWRQDGTANAILTPNGGRAGVGVGAIAFDTTQITSAANYSKPKPDDPCHPLAAGAHPPAVAIQAGATRENPNSGPDGVGVQEGVAYTLEARPEVQAVQSAWAVRRLTPRECERLQGFPDDFTNIPWNGKPTAADGPRYKALGNSMAVNVMRWIGFRIDVMEKLIKEGKV